MNTPKIFKTLAIVAGICGLSVSALANPWEEAIKRTTAIRISNRGDTAWQQYTFVDVIDNSILVRYPKSQNSAEMIAFPFSQFAEGKSRVEVRPTKVLRRALEQLNDETQAKDGVDTLRPIVWPLVKALDIDEAHTNFHRFVRTYFDALVKQEMSAEANAMVRYFDFKNITAEQTEMVVSLIELLLKQGKSKQAFRHLGKLPLTEERKDLQDITVKFGQRLRAAGQYEEAVSIYERLFTLENSEFRQESILWTAYCYFKAGNMESANIYLSLSDKYEPRDREFSLKRLIEGLILIQDGKPTEAMHSISQGIVFSRLGLEWISELMLSSGKAYEAVGRPHVARNVYNELIQFYPNDPFAQEAELRLAELPDPNADELDDEDVAG
ncbi:MAG: tetratricopeptide repeat protein [Opitutales bacterium]